MCHANVMYIWNPAARSCKNGKYLASTIEHSVIPCDEFIKETKAMPTNFNGKNITCETKSFDNLLTFLLVTIPLIIAQKAKFSIKDFFS